MSPGEGRAGSRLYLRQLLSGRDFAREDAVARQMVNFAYAIGDRERGEAILVDPAYSPGEILELVAGDGLRVVGVLLTHYHADHAGGPLFGARVAGVAELLGLVSVPVHVQRDEVPFVEATTGLGPGELVAHLPGDTLEVGELRVQLVHTPGHTPGSQCLLVEERLVTGDTLFLEGCGRTDLPGGDAGALHESIVQRIGALPDGTLVLPGHAYSPAPSAELGALRRTNPVLVPRARAEWLAAFG